MSLNDFEKDAEQIAKIAKKTIFVKTTIFITTHGDNKNFYKKKGDPILASKLLKKIDSVVGKKSNLIIFDASCFSFEHAREKIVFVNPTNFIYVGGTCSNSEHGVLWTTKNYLVYDNLMEPILQKYLYPFEKTHQNFNEFANSISTMETFMNLETITPIKCVQNEFKRCYHFKTDILKGKDLPINDWFDFSPKRKIFLQFFGFKIQYLDDIIWGYASFYHETKEHEDRSRKLFDFTTTKINRFEVLNVTTWVVSKEYPSGSEVEFYEHEMSEHTVFGDGYTVLEKFFVPIDSAETTDFPKRRFFFTSLMNAEKFSFPGDLKDQCTHLFRVYLNNFPKREL